MTAPSLREAALDAIVAIDALTSHFGISRIGESTYADTTTRLRGQAAIEALRAALALPDAEPVAWQRRFIDKDEGPSIWIDCEKGIVEMLSKRSSWEVRSLYTEQLAAPVERKPLTDEWVPVTQSLLNEQHPWLYKPMWVSMMSGVVVQGYYEWRQGRNPDRFITDLGDEWAFNADFVMPITKPTPPDTEAAHGIT